jgi:hypothetical protein
MRNAYIMLLGRPGGMISPRWKDNIEMNVDWILLDTDEDRMRDLVNTLTNPQVT